MGFAAQARSSRISKWITQVLHLDDPERVLVLKLDFVLLVWAFVAGLTKVWVHWVLGMCNQALTNSIP